MTAQDATDAKIKTFEGSVFLYGFLGILRTGGREATGRRREGADALLVEQDRQQQQPLQGPADDMPETSQGLGVGVGGSFWAMR